MRLNLCLLKCTLMYIMIESVVKYYICFLKCSIALGSPFYFLFSQGCCQTGHSRPSGILQYDNWHSIVIQIWTSTIHRGKFIYVYVLASELNHWDCL